MPCLSLKRKAGRGVPDERPCKILKIKGRRVVLDPDDDIVTKPAYARGHAPAPDGRKRRREGDGNDDAGKLSKRAKAGEQAVRMQSTTPTRTQKKRLLPKTVAAGGRPASSQQQGAAKPGLSFFETIQRKGVKPLPPQDSQLRTVLTPKLATPKKAQPLKPQAVSVKPQRRFLPNSSGLVLAPDGNNVASTAAPVSKTGNGIEAPAYAKDASVGSHKRKAEEYAEEPPAKKPAIGKTKTLSWLQTGKLAPTTTYKRYFNKDKIIATKASLSKASKNGNQEDSVKAIGSSVSRAINGGDDSAEKVPSLENSGNCCFANSMLQALHSIPEIRDHFISKVRHHADATLDQSLGLSLGRLFRKMQTVVRNGGKESARDFLQAFGSRHRGYDGSKQQDAYEFLEKLFRELEAEETGSGGLATNDVSLLKELFAGQTVTRLECSLCGKKRDTAIVDACWSMRLNVPQEGRKTTISDCLKRAAATETPEGYACESCGKKDVTSKRERIKSWSKYLLLNCDRVVRKGKVGTKIPIPRYVNLDEHMLDYQPSTSDVGKKMANLFPEFRYEVVAFAEHDGATRKGGHYTATIRKSDKEWYHCDDEKVSRMEREKDLQATTATFIILKRC